MRYKKCETTTAESSRSGWTREKKLDNLYMQTQNINIK